MKGERPAEIVGFARTMRAHAVPAARRRARRVRHLRHGRRRRARSTSRPPRRSSSRLRRAGRQAWQPGGVEPVRQRRRVRSARRERHGAAGGCRALPRRGRHRVLLRADVASRRCSTRGRRAASSACARRSICSGPLTNPARRDAAARRRAAAGAHRAGRARAAAARRGARLGRARRRRTRRDLDARATRRSPSAATGPSTRSTSIRPTSGCAKAAVGGAHGRRRRGERRHRARACSQGTPGPRRDVVLLNAGAALFVAGQRRVRARQASTRPATHRQRTRRRDAARLVERSHRGVEEPRA